MKAVVYERYGSPEVLELRDVPIPTPTDDEVLIRVGAVSLNASDWEALRGKPLYARIGGLRRPRNRILGTDVSGTVEAVGAAVTEFAPGDEIVGDFLGHGAGGFAEYVSVSEQAPLVEKPGGMSFEEAAAIPQAGVIALQGLDQQPSLGSGSTVLLNGAGGGSGTYALQLALQRGATVTAVDNEHKLDLLRSLGAERVVDYRTQDVTKLEQHYDLIVDLAAHRPTIAYRRILRSGGVYAMVGGSMRALLGAVTMAPLLSRFGDRRLGLLAVRTSKDELRRALDVVARGEAGPIIDRNYPLDEVPEALRRLGEGRALGKLVVTVGG